MNINFCVVLSLCYAAGFTRYKPSLTVLRDNTIHIDPSTHDGSIDRLFIEVNSFRCDKRVLQALRRRETRLGRDDIEEVVQIQLAM